MYTREMSRKKKFGLALKMAEITQSQFADSIGVSKQLVSQILMNPGQSRPVCEKIDKFIKQYLTELKESFVN